MKQQELPIETSLKNTLDELQRILSQLSDEQYGLPLQILSDASIGQHTRHIVEFFQVLHNSYKSGVVNYDKRQRNRLLETDCSLALIALTEIKKNISQQDKEILLVGSYSYELGDEIIVRSSYHREVLYNLEHAIHHMAMIKIGVRQTTQLQVPPDFGVAPATIQHRKSA